MQDFKTIINLLIVVVGFCAGIFCLLMAVFGKTMERWNRRFFTGFLTIQILYVFFCLLGMAVWEEASPLRVFLCRAAIFAESAAAGVMMLLITVLMLHSVGIRDAVRTRFFRISMGMALVYFACLTCNWYSGVFYRVIEETNTYRRGPLYPLLLVPPAMLMINNLIFFIKNHSLLSRNQRNAFSAYLVFPILGILFQMFFYGVRSIVLGVTLGTVAMFLFMLQDGTDWYARQQKENAQLKIDIMLAQIQPHFLINSLQVIRQLCVEAPETAAEAIDDFNRFLRHNMDSLRSDKPVPFADELEHVKEYVRLQQLRFGDALEVEYRIGCDDFCLPTLTLQPIVENAVKYGVRKNEDGRGRVVLTTGETAENYIVTVEDSGPGFDYLSLPQENRDSHIGIENVKARMAGMCGGRLEIRSEEGKGTTVTLTVPKEKMP